MKKPITNISASILQRLMNYRKVRNEEFSVVVSRYIVERFLYRLSISQFSDSFVLKGAQLFTLWSEITPRTTRDLDLLHYGDSSIDSMVSTIRHICSIPCEEDGVEFLLDTVRGEAIREQANYIGVRILMSYRIGTLHDTLQIDVGFGDAVVSLKPKQTVTAILENLPAPVLLAYSRETVIAEKYEAMVILGIRNSRMKDFFDIWTLFSKFTIDESLLEESILATFTRRNTPFPKDTPLALTEEFAMNPDKMKQWSAFLKRTRATGIPSELEVVIGYLRERLEPVRLNLRK